MACSGDSGKRSSSGPRTIAPALSGGLDHRTPRTSAAGTPSAFPITSPDAPAISSARASTVASRTRPEASFVPRRSTRDGRPAQPMATFTNPWRQGRPKVSVMSTPTRTPTPAANAWRISSALVSGSSGSSVRNPSATFDASTPALAQTNPCLVSAMTRSPRRATTRRLSDATHSARPPGPSGTTRPSDLDTIFCVTTRTSPSRSARLARAMASCRRVGRSSPGSTSPISGMGRISTVMWNEPGPGPLWPRAPRRRRRP